jgi:alginate O-acetyltransferase complex protein AlgI
MLFNSFSFLLFFAVVAGVYYAVPHRWRWLLLLVASYYFYSSFALKYLLLLGFATLVAYGAGLMVGGRRDTRTGRLALVAGVAGELSVLVAFKYFDFLMGSFGAVLSRYDVLSETTALPRLGLLLPAGLSFYTFSCISYVVDAYRGTLPAERHLGKLALYVAFFPKLLAGPIERAPAFLDQLAAPVRVDTTQVLVGLQLMLWGLFKKVVIADRLAVFVDQAYAMPAFESPLTVIIGVYFYAFQIYCDFSGYSDIAIGAALVLGFRLMENFRRPYLSRSVPEFWNSRWHLSLMRWFRDYLYIPLGGSRVSMPRWYANVLIVFLVSGLWHGAAWTFVIWGGINGLYQVIHLATARPRSWLSRMAFWPSWIGTILSILLTFHLIGLSWVFFRADSLPEAVAVLAKLWNGVPQLLMLAPYYNWTGELWLSLGLIVLLLMVEVLDERRPVVQRLASAPTGVRWGCYYAVALAIVTIGAWGMNEFVYMQF